MGGLLSRSLDPAHLGSGSDEEQEGSEQNNSRFDLPEEDGYANDIPVWGQELWESI